MTFLNVISFAMYIDIHMQIDEEVLRLERQLKQTTGEVSKIYNKIQKRVIQEISIQDVIYCEADSPLLFPQEEIFQKDFLSTRINNKLNKLANFQILTRYIEFTVKQLERRQIAESITKILKVEKPRTYGGEARITLCFEQGMGLRPLVVSESEFLQINSLREYSLLKFYNTASKSPYTFVCQNVSQHLFSIQVSRICMKNVMSLVNSKI